MDKLKEAVTKKVLKFEDLEVWQKGHQLVLEIYRKTNNFPSDERFGLISQMRRAAVSVPANISEGFKKRHLKDKINYYNIAHGSLEELRYYLILSRDLGYLKEHQQLSPLVDQVGRMLHGLVASLTKKPSP